MRTRRRSACNGHCSRAIETLDLSGGSFSVQAALKQVPSTSKPSFARTRGKA